MKSGIYAITSPSGGQYIGSAVNLARRQNAHMGHLRRGTHHCKALQRAADKYGVDALRFEVICYVEDITMLIQREQAAFEEYRPRYNTLKVAGSSLGHKHTDETKAKFTSRRKTPMTPELRAKISANLAGRPCSVETREKLAQAHRGKVMSDESKARMAAAQLGKKRSLEARQAQSLALRGRQKPAEWCQRMSELHKGRVVSEEAKAKMSASHLGVKMSDETRARMAAAKAGTRPSEACLAASIAASTGRVLSQGSRDKISEGLRGKVQSPETIAKRAASNRAAWERKRAAAAVELASPLPPEAAQP